MDSVSFARRESELCCAETGERHKVARLKRMNVPLRRVYKKATHRHSKKKAVVVVGRSVESCIQWSVNGHGERSWEQVVSSRDRIWFTPNAKLTQCSLTSALRLIANMSRRAAIVEEFDDDTDLPLPSLSLPDTGSRGAIIEEIADTDDDEEGDIDEAPELLDPSAIGSSALQSSARDTRVTDITPYKKYANDINL
jgi:hypothetical protein